MYIEFLEIDAKNNSCLLLKALCLRNNVKHPIQYVYFEHHNIAKKKCLQTKRVSFNSPYEKHDCRITKPKT